MRLLAETMEGVLTDSGKACAAEPVMPAKPPDEPQLMPAAAGSQGANAPTAPGAG
jgi:hypothetical protein